MVNPHAGTYGEGHAEHIRSEVDTAFHQMWRTEQDLDLALAHTGAVFYEIAEAQDDPSIPKVKMLIARANAAIVCGRLSTGATLMSRGREGDSEGERALDWLRDGDTALKEYRELASKNHQFKVHHATHATVAETMFGSRLKALKHLGVHATLGMLSESPRFFDYTSGLNNEERRDELDKRVKGNALVSTIYVLRLSGQRDHATRLALEHITL